MSRRQNEKGVLLSGEYKLRKSIVHIDTHATLVTELVRQLQSICLMPPRSLRKATP